MSNVYTRQTRKPKSKKDEFMDYLTSFGKEKQTNKQANEQTINNEAEIIEVIIHNPDSAQSEIFEADNECKQSRQKTTSSIRGFIILMLAIIGSSIGIFYSFYDVKADGRGITGLAGMDGLVIWGDPDESVSCEDSDIDEGEERRTNEDEHTVHTYPCMEEMNDGEFKIGMRNVIRAEDGKITIGEWAAVPVDNSEATWSTPEGREEYLNQEKLYEEHRGRTLHIWAHGGYYIRWLDRNGFGIYVDKNGQKYEGEWRKHKRDGPGKQCYAGGEVYDGEWVKDQRHGPGKQCYADGKVYDGEWVNDLRHGNGVMKYANGKLYDGGWVNDRRHGLGSETEKGGKTRFKVWRHGVLEKCSICLEELSQKDKTEITMLHCEHGYHYGCIKQWVVSQVVKNCPLCKQNINGDDRRKMDLSD